MRELKFRIWGKKEKSFVEENKDGIDYSGPFFLDLQGKLRIAVYPCGNGDNSADSVFDPIGNQDDYVIQQYTGQKDKNGKEIYEGDILSYGMGPEYEVVWDNLYAKWEFPTITNQDGMYRLNIGQVRNSTLIGNVNNEL